MKKAILAGLCFMLVSLMLVDGTFAMPDLNEVFAGLNKVFADLTEILGDGFGKPEDGGETVRVSLVSDDPIQQLFPGGAASSTAAVRNDGTRSVYFRLVYAIQYDEQSWDKLDIDFEADPAYYVEEEWLDTMIGSTPYKMKVFTYTGALDAQAESPEVKITIAMDSSFTTEEINRLRSDFLQTQVLAIDPTHFTEKDITTAQEALDKALPLNNFHPF